MSAQRKPVRLAKKIYQFNWHWSRSECIGTHAHTPDTSIACRAYVFVCATKIVSASEPQHQPAIAKKFTMKFCTTSHTHHSARSFSLINFNGNVCMCSTIIVSCRRIGTWTATLKRWMNIRRNERTVNTEIALNEHCKQIMSAVCVPVNGVPLTVTHFNFLGLAKRCIFVVFYVSNSEWIIGPKLDFCRSNRFRACIIYRISFSSCLSIVETFDASDELNIKMPTEMQ